MSWDRDPLCAKARLFFEQAFDTPHDDRQFGLWCSFGLELLARAALSSISPTLLAEPDQDQRNLLFALGRGSERAAKSLSANRVFTLCEELFAEYTKEDVIVSRALLNRRNEELHSAGAGFGAYPSSRWLAGFYKACQSLSHAMGESLASLFPEEQAVVAATMITNNTKDIMQRVMHRISSHGGVFRSKSEPERNRLHTCAKEWAQSLAFRGHHRVECPACGGAATVQGTPFGKEHITDEAGEIVVRQAVAPSSFFCSACELKLDGYAELEAAELGGHYSRRTTCSPDQYYGLINPDDLPEHIEEYLAGEMREYDNE